jgi:maltose O-acetyltransferase
MRDGAGIGGRRSPLRRARRLAERRRMTSEWTKMVSGAHYDPSDADLVRARERARALLWQFNHAPLPAHETRREALAALLGACGQRVRIEPPFHCDYGRNIDVGDDVYMNVGCIVLDCAPVRIGARVLIGSGVQLVTAAHPIDASQRRSGLEFARPVVVAEDAWIGAGVIVCPGVSIGARSVIGAGSVVVRDIPADVVAVGNPCRVLRSLAQSA